MPSIFESVFIFACHLVAICDWQKLPSIDDAQPLAAVAPKDSAGPPASPPANPAPAPAPVNPAPVPVQAAPVKPVVAPPVKPAPVPVKSTPSVKPLPKPPKSTDPTVVTIRSSGNKTIARKRLKEGQEPCDTTLTVRTDDAGKVQSITVEVESAALVPYNKGGGHHVPSKKAMEGAPNYDAKKALAIPNTELDRLKMKHRQVITPNQQKAYLDFAKKGQPLSWESIAKIETEVLIKSGMKPEMAKATVAKAIQALKEANVPGPTRIPWG